MTDPTLLKQYLAKVNWSYDAESDTVAGRKVRVHSERPYRHWRFLLPTASEVQDDSYLQP